MSKSNPAIILKLALSVVILCAASYLLAILVTPYQPYPFHWVFIRTLQVSVLISIVIDIYLEKIGHAALGFSKGRRYSKEIIFGFITGIISLLIILGVKGILHAVRLDIDRDPLRHLRMYFLNIPRVFLIAFLEEIIFRGFLIYQLRKSYQGKKLIILAALIFALPHFFRLLPDMSVFITQLTGIFLVGIMFSWIYVRSGAIYLSIGLHAGWIYFLKIDGLFIDHIDKTPYWLYGDDWMVSCVLGWPMIVALIYLFSYYIKKHKLSPR